MEQSHSVSQLPMYLTSSTSHPLPTFSENKYRLQPDSILAPLPRWAVKAKTADSLFKGMSRDPQQGSEIGQWFLKVGVQVRQHTELVADLHEKQMAPIFLYQTTQTILLPPQQMTKSLSSDRARGLWTWGHQVDVSYWNRKSKWKPTH